MFLESGRNLVKLKLIDSCVPEQSFKFPGRKYDSKCKSGVYTRYCNRDWLNEFQFLSYSKSLDGLYCLSCILFPWTSQAQRAELLIATPYQYWKKAHADIANHSTLKYHLLSECKRQAFLDTCRGTQMREDQYMTLESDKRIATNQLFLKSIIMLGILWQTRHCTTRAQGCLQWRAKSREFQGTYSVQNQCRWRCFRLPPKGVLKAFHLHF